MNPTKLARISALALVLFLSALSASAVQPCGCDYCQSFPEQNCGVGDRVRTCAQFLMVAFCPSPSPASAEAASSEESFLADLSGPTQEPVGCLSPAS